jgi:hypothetical protein
MDAVAAAPVSRLQALYALARPRGMWWVASLPVLGWGFAHWDRALPMQRPGALVALFVGWLALHAGTMWLNAALDRDEGDVLLGESVPVPEGIARFGYGALVVAVALATLAGAVPTAAAAACALLAVLYSHPRVAWKAHAALGPAVNVLGYGVLSPIAGYAVVGALPGARGLVSLAMLASIVLGTYFAAQAFQEDEDRARGYRTLVATHGTPAVLRASRIAYGLGFAVAVGLAATGWYPRPCLVAIPAMIAMDRLLVTSSPAPRAFAQGLVTRLLLVGALLIAGAYAAYAVELATTDGPFAGAATAGGQPGW